MAATERDTADTEGALRMDMPPSEEDTPPLLNNTSAPLIFSELTPHEFGISVRSFTPSSLPNYKDKSRLARIKARRRSSVGVRGSPETNSLICFMAQQRMKTPTLQTPELVRSSPYFPRVASTLRQKMASFQSLMVVEDSEVCDPVPRQDSTTGGCIKTRDYLSDVNSPDGGKENHPPQMTPTASKRRRLGPLETCELEIRETSAPIPHFSLKELEDNVFEPQSPNQPPPDDSASPSPTQPAPSHGIISFPSPLEMKPSGDDDCTGMSTVKKKKKSVRFGELLSPELFDKNLPPSTPLQKGGTPARAPTPGGSLKLRSLLKTPQRNESQSPQAESDLSSLVEFGASPILSVPRHRRVQPVDEMSEDSHGKAVVWAIEELDSVVTSDAECMQDAQPLNLDTAFHEESLAETLKESETKPSTASPMNALDEPTSPPEQESQLEANVEVQAQPRNQRKKAGPEQESSSKAPTRSSSRKRKHSEESEPVKRSTRSAAKMASGRMKMSSTAKRLKSRDVDRSLYGSRTYASKNPTLSPITERLSSGLQPPTAELTTSASCTVPNHESHPSPETRIDNQIVADVTVTNVVENPTVDSCTSSNTSKEDTAEKSRTLSEPKVRGRELKKRKVCGVDGVLHSEETGDHTEGNTKEHCEDQTTINPKGPMESPLTHTAPQQAGADTELNAQAAVDTHCTDSDQQLECHGRLDEHVLDCPAHNILSLPSEPTQRKGKRGRRSSVKSSVLQEQGNQAEEHQTSHVVETNQQAGEAASQQENITSSSDSQEEEGAATLELAPWQGDFNFDDVFKPVATRRQRSVRRSLRNQSKAEPSNTTAGLAWLPWTSPDSIKEAHKTIRGRRLSAAAPVQPSLQGGGQDAS